MYIIYMYLYIIYMYIYIITQCEEGFPDKPNRVANNKIISTWLRLAGFIFSQL
jgi:hypothetical protein